MRTMTEQLAADGLRLARPGEAGWYTLVECDPDESGRTVRRVWATDEPE